MKNLFILFFFLVSFFSFVSSVFAGGITRINTTSNIEKHSGLATINVDNMFVPQGTKWKASFERNSIVKTKNLDCSFTGKNVLTIYYMNGTKKDSIQSLVEIQDNWGYCPKKTISPDSISVVGIIKTQNGKCVDAESILYKFDISQKIWKNLSNDGEFIFDSLDQEFYGLEIKNTDLDCVSGVSTADIVKIQKHILNIERFNSPYQYLAGDVNGDKSINSTDIKIIREMILGKIYRWPNFRPAWMFIPANYKFVNNTVPWQSMPDVKNNIPLDCSKEINYIAVKMGDVNGSSTGNLWENNLQARSSNSEDLALEEESRFLDLKIQELEKNSQKEILVFELKFLNESSLQGWKK